MYLRSRGDFAEQNFGESINKTFQQIAKILPPHLGNELFGKS